MGDIRKEILTLLDKYGADTKRALRENKRLEYLYALAPLRENLLEWYEFKKESRLLQIGADFGALTGLFLERCASVTVLDEAEENLEIVRARYPDRENLTCICGNLSADTEDSAPQKEIVLKETAMPGANTAAEGEADIGLYDYVTVLGSWKENEPVEAQIKKARKLLAPGGVLLAAACNRFGIKYLAGAKPDAVTVTKRELEELLPGSRFYYPMPDYRLPGEIYSDSYLPKKGDLTGTLTLYDYPEYLLMDVGAVCDAVCGDGQFDNFANSFLVVWKKGV